MSVSLLRREGGLANALARLEARFGARFSRGAEIRRQHANTVSWLPNEPADAVVFAESTEEVAELTRIWRLLTTAELRHTPRVAAFFDFIVGEIDTLRPIITG